MIRKGAEFEHTSVGQGYCPQTPEKGGSSSIIYIIETKQSNEEGDDDSWYFVGLY